jgi:hypothetical protein
MKEKRREAEHDAAKLAKAEKKQQKKVLVAGQNTWGDEEL